MAEFRRLIVTDKGQNLIAKMIAGENGVKFTRLGLSATDYQDDQIMSLTELEEVKQSVNVSRVTKLSDAAVKLEAAVTNEDISVGYQLHSIGVYAKDPDEGEILYGVAGANVAGYIPPYNGVTVSGVFVTVTTAVTNADHVDLSVDPAAVATIGDIERLQTEISDLKALLGYTEPDIYGVEVDFRNKTFTRLAGAVGKNPGEDFDSIPMFGGRRRCNLADDGTVTAYYNEDGYTETGKLLKDVGRKSTGDAVQVMVEQPKVYYRMVPLELEKIADGSGYHVRKARYYVTHTPKPGFKLHPAFISNNVEKDIIYLAAYEACIWDTDGETYANADEVTPDFDSDKLSSIANVKPASGKDHNLTRDNCRKMAHSRGSGWELSYLATVSVSQLLMLIEYASFDMQTAIGAGVTTKTDDQTTSMTENTGGSATLGNKSGSVTNENNQNIVSYRGEENFWGNIWTFVDGVNVDANSIHRLYVADHGFKDSEKAAPYQDTGITLAKANGYVSAFGYTENFDWIFMPSETTGDSALPVGDHFWQNAPYSGIMICVLGARWSDGLRAGAFNFSVHSIPSVRSRDLGARLVYIPK